MRPSGKMKNCTPGHSGKKKKAGLAYTHCALCKEVKSTEGIPNGGYRGFEMELSYDTFEQQFHITLKGEMRHQVSLGQDARGNLTRLDNALAGIPARLKRGQEQLENLQNQQATAQVELASPSLKRRSLPRRVPALRSCTPP